MTDRAQWVALRRSVVADYYDLPATLQPEAEELFARMEALASECADQGEFETRLAASPLTGEYNDLLARLAPYVKKDAAAEAQLKRERAAGRRRNIAANVSQKVRSEVLHELNTHLPIEDYKWGEPWYFAIPIVGPILKHILGTADQVRSLQNFGRNPQEKWKQLNKQD